jgi:peptidoglycan/LPS O-acetylase OafA/YrhL
MSMVNPLLEKVMAAKVTYDPPQTQHIDSLDGIRGVAVLMVLMLHAGCFHNGWLGVDLFFVLSGFLITGILRKSRTQPFYWRRFYIKRATRIFPPIVLGIAVTALFWPHASLIGAAGYLLSLGNVMDMTRFAIKPIGHLWSLSVEEHYYLFWPFAILAMSKRQLKWLIGAIVVILPLARLLFTYRLPAHDPYAIYLLTPFRIDGIAMGSLLALLLEEESWQEILKKCAGTCFVLTSVVYLTLWTMVGHVNFFPHAYSPIFNGVGYTLVALIAFFVIAYARLLPDAFATRILRNRLLRGIGVISYGVYVYSWILLVFMRRSFPSLSEFQTGVIHVFVVIPVAAILFKYYEQPITAWGKRRAALMSAKPNPVAGKNALQTERQPLEIERGQQAGVAVL